MFCPASLSVRQFTEAEIIITVDALSIVYLLHPPVAKYNEAAFTLTSTAVRWRSDG